MSSSEFEKAVVQRLHRVLKAEGYRKTGLRFDKPGPDVHRLIQVQKSTSSTRDVLKFTLNVGIFSRFLGELIGKQPERPHWSECHWRYRIGHLTAYRDDHWWVARNIDEAEAAAEEIEHWIRAAVLPAVDALASTPQLRELWGRGEYGGLSELERQRYVSLLAEALGPEQAQPGQAGNG